ncbi:site-2 protease family protein [Crenalkalicoccus roseus]|uniref:site-2 protease family protein n=1 Tax=Crenalkalicoccus roseus TaxID=1485588 RepID=UPI00108148A0|nr:site-2 protease family protein [Crenalkalicoccus roseus]
MSWSFPIGTVKGTVIRVHLTFFLLLLWIGGSAYAIGGADAALASIVFILLLFGCVLLHEFGHVFAARRYGVQTPDITLLPIGGVARLERIPEKPSEELVVAMAGPAVNVVIAAVLFLILGGIPSVDATAVHSPGHGILERLAWVNVMLVLFNLIPAFPMDGGRMLRAFLAWRMGYVQATRIAAGVGQAVAFALGLLGLFGGNPLLVFIALFVYLGAAAESQAVQMRDIGRGIPVRDAMITRFESLPPSATVEDAVQLLIQTTQREFPVVDGAGTLRGILTRDAMIRALKEQGPATPVLEVMHRDIPLVGPRQCLSDAMQALHAGGNPAPAVGVADQSGRLIGLVTPENVGEMVMVQQARPPGPPPGPRNPWARHQAS